MQIKESELSPYQKAVIAAENRNRAQQAGSEKARLRARGISRTDSQQLEAIAQRPAISYKETNKNDLLLVAGVAVATSFLLAGMGFAAAWRSLSQPTPEPSSSIPSYQAVSGLEEYLSEHFILPSNPNLP